MSTSALDSVWATPNDRKKADEDLPSTRHTSEPQTKKEKQSESSSASPVTTGTSTLDSRWATTYDSFRSEQGLPATKFSESLAQRRADLHPEESDQPLTLIDDQQDRTAQDWRSNNDRTGREYNSFGRSSFNGPTSPRQWSNNNYQSRGSFHDRDRSSTGLSAGATSWYPESLRRQQRQSPQPAQYEPVSARPWNMIAMKKKLPSSETSTEPSWIKELESAGPTADNRTESAIAGKPTADEAWDEPVPKEHRIPVASVVAYKLTANSVSQNPSAENPVQSTAISQLSRNNEHIDNNITTNTADSSISVWNTTGSSTWDPSNVPWDNEPASPKPSGQSEGGTKNNNWNTLANQASETNDAAQPYSITISLRSHSPTILNNSPAQPAQETRDPVKKLMWNSKPEPSTAQLSNRDTQRPTESSTRQTREQPVLQQEQAARVEPPQTSWSNSVDPNRNVTQESHQQATTFSQKEENHNFDNDGYVLPQKTSCRPWDVDKYKHRLWEQ